MPDPVVMLRAQLVNVVLGTIFLSFGLTACAIAAIRQRTEVRVLIWLGIWSGLYGASLLARTLLQLEVLPQSLLPVALSVVNAIRYLLIVAAVLAWSELTLGKVRRFLQVIAILGLAIALAGIASFFVTGSAEWLLPYNNLLATLALLVLAVILGVPRLSKRFLVSSSPVLTFGTFIFLLDALYRNLSGGLQLPSLRLPWFDEFAFACFLFSFAYVAIQKVFASERRLLSIENELEIARQIQASILPTTTPEIENLRIAASYRPMTAVGGDFYDFLQIDRQRIGFLVADVSGHGVPAALIASMIKVAVQSVVACAHDPGEVLRRLNHILAAQLRGQFVSAAYLWIDTEHAAASYSAAGHPPLLRWRNGELERIVSNGLLLGVLPDADYPVDVLRLSPGDRFLLCTDGVTEPENAAGESFGDHQLEAVFRSGQARSPVEFSTELLAAVGQWQPTSASQQDDITTIVVDVV